jgi:hypothetical protein
LNPSPDSVLVNPDNSNAEFVTSGVKAAAATLGVQIELAHGRRALRISGG